MSGFCVACGKPVVAEALRCSDCASHTDAVWAPPDARAERDEGEAEVNTEAPVKVRCMLAQTVLALVLVSLMAAIQLPNFLRARARGHVTGCKSSLKNIGTALEMYSADNKGYYPATLRPLAPSYLRQLPVCSSSGHDSYSEGYTSFASGRHDGYVDVAAYTVVCRGLNHTSAGYSENYPQYTSSNGLLDR